MRKDAYFREVARSVLSLQSNEDDILSLMVVLHTYRFHIPPSVRLDDAGIATMLYPLTHNHSAEIVASVFPAADKQRHDCNYWYRKFHERTPFEVASEIDGVWRSNVDSMISLLKRTGLVTDLSEDD